MYQLIHRAEDNTKVTIEASDIKVATNLLRNARNVSEGDDLKGDFYTIFWTDLQPQQSLPEYQQ